MTAPTRVLKTARYAMSFDGVNDYASVPHDDVFNLTDEATFEVMFYKTKKDVRGDLMGKNGTTWHAILVNHYNELMFQIYDGVGWPGTTALTKIESNRWYHAIIHVNWRTPSEGAIVRFYINGEFDSERTLSYQEKLTVVDSVKIGTLSVHWDGLIAFVRIYSRGLTDDEIKWNFEHPEDPIKNGLILWLHADPSDIDGSTWVDRSGNNNNATLSGARLVNVVKRVPKYAFRFDGVDDYVSINDSLSFDVSEVTIEGFVRFPITPVEHGQHACIWNRGNARILYLLIGHRVYNKFQFLIRVNDVLYALMGETGIKPGIWYHVVGRYDGKAMSLYVDGVKEAELGVSGALDTYREMNYIGYAIGSDYSLMDLGFVRLYNRALSDEEIKRNYENINEPVRDGLILWLQADVSDFDGSTWYDRSGSGNNAVPNGPALTCIVCPKKENEVFVPEEPGGFDLI